MKISILIPAHNEEDNIVSLIDEIEKSIDIPHELVVVNDHSTDRTMELMQKSSKQYNNIKLAENNLDKGFANALRTGFNNTDSELVVPIMADLCDDLSTIPIMLEKINEGYDVISGSRYIKGGVRIGGPKLKGFLSRLGGLSLHYLSGVPTTDIANSFKMYKKIVIDSLNIESRDFEISMEITLKAHYSGFKITEVPTVWKERTKGVSNFKTFKLLPRYLKLYAWGIFKRLIG